MGVWRTNRAALPHIIASKGYILNIASTAAMLHGPLMSAYSRQQGRCRGLLRLACESRSSTTASTSASPTSSGSTPTWCATATTQPAFKKFRNSLKGPAGKTLPVSAAVDATVEGIAKRSRPDLCARLAQAGSSACAASPDCSIATVARPPPSWCG